MRVSVKAEIEQRKAEGNFFRKDPTRTMMGNALDAVEWLSEEGAKQLRPKVPVGTGFTRDNIEGFTYKRTQLLTGRDVQSRFGKTRLRKGLSRTGSARWPAAQRPYVTMSVLETGTYKGHPRRANRMVRAVYRRMKIYERTIRRDLTKGLE